MIAIHTTLIILDIIILHIITTHSIIVTIGIGAGAGAIDLIITLITTILIITIGTDHIIIMVGVVVIGSDIIMDIPTATGTDTGGEVILIT